MCQKIHVLKIFDITLLNLKVSVIQCKLGCQVNELTKLIFGLETVTAEIKIFLPIVQSSDR